MKYVVSNSHEGLRNAIAKVLTTSLWQRCNVLWVRRWGGEKGCAKLVEWVEENVEETLSVYRLPREHRKRMKSTNMLERLNEEIRRRTRVARIFANVASCLRLVRALAVETHEQWVTGKRYLTGTIGLAEDVERDGASLRKAA